MLLHVLMNSVFDATPVEVVVTNANHIKSIVVTEQVNLPKLRMINMQSGTKFLAEACFNAVTCSCEQCAKRRSWWLRAPVPMSRIVFVAVAGADAVAAHGVRDGGGRRCCRCHCRAWCWWWRRAPVLLSRLVFVVVAGTVVAAHGVRGCDGRCHCRSWR